MSAAEKLDVMASPPEETESFDELVRAHRARVVGLCFRYSGNHADAEDLAQEVFLRAYRGLSRFRGDARISTWLYRIAVNVCLNWISARKRPAEELPEGLADSRPSASEHLVRDERRAIVHKAVLALPERQRMTLLLRVYEELSHREIAETMGCPVGTAKANFFFALKNLRKRLETESSNIFVRVR